MAVIQASTYGDQAVNPLWPRLHLRPTLEPALISLLNAIPDPLSIIPVRSPPMRQMR